MSAAKADPDTIASAVANKAIFFILFPITFQNLRPMSGAPAADDDRLRPNLRKPAAIWNAFPNP
jgi:hypothetical protein